MTSYVRKNLLTLSGKFFTPEPCTTPPTPEPEPSAAFVSIAFYAPPPVAPVPCPPDWCAPSPVLQHVTVALVLGMDGETWSCQWDTSVADGKVWWAVYSVGSVVAAAQGSFTIIANPANLLVA